MMRTLNSPVERKFAPKTAEPMFRRIDNLNNNDSRVTKTSKQSRNFPMLNKSSVKRLMSRGNSMDLSKQNMMFENYLQKVNSANKIDEKSIVSNYLNSLRKDYDKMHKETKNQMSTISVKKKDIQFIKQRLRMQQQSVQTLQQKISDKQNQMTKIQSKQEQVQTQRKTLDHIIFRMKKDQIFYKQFGRVYEGHINDKKKVLKAAKEHLIHQDQKIHKLVLNIEEMKKQFQKNQQFRQRKLEDYYEKLENIHEKQLFIQQRKQRTLQLQSIESNDILKAKNIEMRNICLINKVADCLFENKIQNLIKHYEDVQKAFHTIQVKTSISDPTLIASKFFSYEQLTENLLKAISGYEKKLEQKTKRNQFLKQQYKKLEQRTYYNESVNSIELQKHQKKKQEIEQINEKHLTYQRVLEWVQRTSKHLKLCGQDHEDFSTKLINICLKTKTQMSELQKTVKPYEKKYVTPGIRIKKIIRESGIQQKSLKLKEVQQLRQSNIVEDQYLNATRIGIKRNFMIKQKTMNMTNLSVLKDSKVESLISDRKVRASENK